MNRRITSTCLIGACCALTFAACETADPPGGRPGTTKWHWMNAVEYYDRSEFIKMADEMNQVVDRDDEYKDRAVMWRLAALHGMGQGLMALGDGFRTAIEEKEALVSNYQNAIQQGNRDSRSFAIMMAESMGDVEKLMQGEAVTLDFPFPEGESAPSPILEQIKETLPVKPEQVATAMRHEVKRGMILAATQLAGEEDPAKAKAKFDAGPVQVPTTEFKFTLAAVMLDTGLLFSKARIFDPKIRNIFIDRAEKIVEEFADSEDKELKDRAEEFAKEIEDERRDIQGKARRQEKRE